MARTVAEAALQLAVFVHVGEVLVASGAIAPCFVTGTTARFDLVGARFYANKPRVMPLKRSSSAAHLSAVTLLPETQSCRVMPSAENLTLRFWA